MNEEYIESKKMAEWITFSSEVMDHIEDYCIPQYGDYPDKSIERWKPEDIKSFLEKYVQRIGTGVRGSAERKRDCLKIAHYACYLHTKLKEEEDG